MPRTSQLPSRRVFLERQHVPNGKARPELSSAFMPLTYTANQSFHGKSTLFVLTFINDGPWPAIMPPSLSISHFHAKNSHGGSCRLHAFLHHRSVHMSIHLSWSPLSAKSMSLPAQLQDKPNLISAKKKFTSLRPKPSNGVQVPNNVNDTS
jgi:hypothetical protein